MVNKGRDDQVEKKTTLQYDENGTKNPVIGCEGLNAPIKS